MNQNELFEKIKNESVSEKEYVIKILKMRGFLFEEISNELYISDNSHCSDGEYLNKLLKKYKIGYVQGDKVIIENMECNELIANEFCNYIQVEKPSCWNERDWRWFKRREHGEKVAVSCLEPFIARYIKAISACCVLTVGSCDGNHSGKNKMYIMTEGEGSIPWLRLICEKCLNDKFDIRWTDKYRSMVFSDETKYATYYEVNKAAEYLYAKRKAIRQIKNTAFSEITNVFLKSHSSEEIEKKFIGIASELFDTWNL